LVPPTSKVEGATEDISAKVLKNLSQRARDSLTEEMGLLGNVQAVQVKQAQAQMAEVIQRLDLEGKLVMVE
jgi:flagellar motor switch protein FliG